MLNVVEDQTRGLYTVTLQPQDLSGNNSGNITTFVIPKYPPKTNVSTLGSNFKQMIDKGLNPINIKITYDQNNRFLSWESVMGKEK